MYHIILFLPEGLDRSLLYNISQLPVRVFTEVAIATAVNCWNWLLTKRPDLEYPVSVCMNNQRTTSPLRIGLDVIRSHPGRILANTSPHQLCWGDWEMETAISCRHKRVCYVHACVLCGCVCATCILNQTLDDVSLFSVHARVCSSLEVDCGAEKGSIFLFSSQNAQNERKTSTCSCQATLSAY